MKKTYLLVVMCAALLGCRDRDQHALSITSVDNLRASGSADVTGEVIARSGVRLTAPTTGPLLKSGTGDPNGAVTAPRGSIFMRTDSSGGVYWNTDGSTAWSLAVATPISSAKVTFHGVKASTTVAVTGLNNTSTNITWNTEEYDTDSYHSTSTNTDRITIPAGLDGYYLLECRTQFGSSATGLRLYTLRKNAAENPAGGTPLEIRHEANVGVTGGQDDETVFITHLAASDEVECFATQSSGGTLNLISNQVGEYWSATLLGI